MDQRPIRRLRPDPGAPPTAEQLDRWPRTVPAGAQIATEGLELPAGALVLVGENGSGKSTMMELLAVSLGPNPEGGSVNTRQSAGAPEQRFHERSHGEAFLQVLGDRARSAGAYLFDEPDAALAFGGSLALVAVLLDLVAGGSSPRCPARSWSRSGTGACARPAGKTWS